MPILSLWPSNITAVCDLWVASLWTSSLSATCLLIGVNLISPPTDCCVNLIIPCLLPPYAAQDGILLQKLPKVVALKNDQREGMDSMHVLMYMQK